VEFRCEALAISRVTRIPNEAAFEMNAIYKSRLLNRDLFSEMLFSLEKNIFGLPLPSKKTHGTAFMIRVLHAFILLPTSYRVLISISRVRDVIPRRRYNFRLALIASR